MTARLQHITIRDHLPRVRMLARQREQQERRDALWRAAREGMSEAWRMWWALVRNPWTWVLAAAFVMWASTTGRL